VKVIYQPEWRWTGVYDFWRQTPTEFWNMKYWTAIGLLDQKGLPNSSALTGGLLKPGFQSATHALVTNGDTSTLEAAGIVFPKDSKKISIVLCG
jgi:hypothetical protein